MCGHSVPNALSAELSGLSYAALWLALDMRCGKCAYLPLTGIVGCCAPGGVRNGQPRTGGWRRGIAALCPFIVRAILAQHGRRSRVSVSERNHPGPSPATARCHGRTLSASPATLRQRVLAHHLLSIHPQLARFVILGTRSSLSMPVVMVAAGNGATRAGCWHRVRWLPGGRFRRPCWIGRLPPSELPVSWC
jgi:hypothetical protein